MRIGPITERLALRPLDCPLLFISEIHRFAFFRLPCVTYVLADSDEQWGEHEIDYVMFVRKVCRFRCMGQAVELFCSLSLRHTGCPPSAQPK